MRFTAPLWAAPFRPFYLLGALYALLLAGAWLFAPQTPAQAAAWHGHEMLFGFATAIISGILLTALPSWAGTPEWQGPRLALLVACWLAGRIAFWCEALPLPLRALLDVAYFPVLMFLLSPQLLRLGERQFLWLLPILGGFAAAQLLFWLGKWQAATSLTQAGLHWGLHALLLLFVVKGGLLTPIFTGNALRERRLGEAPKLLPELEYALGVAVLLLALAEPLATPPASLAAVCLGTALLLGFRSWRWRGWQVAALPMLAAMHVAFVWLIGALVLRGWAALDARLAPGVWQHAFLVGAVGAMMLSLMNRVSLRHTGRPLAVSATMRLALALVSLAAVLRVVASLLQLDSAWAAGAMTLWASAFGLYLFEFGPVLCSPSRPRAASAEEAAGLKRETPP
ncbi:hypothetical protein BURK2_03279 [Burkholderiales bacterium]|nr:hypothetical protein BURK2_03279 [Burkholderiales bacterium]